MILSILLPVQAAPDRDNDGIGDDVDTVVGDAESIISNMNLTVTIGPYDSTEPEVSSLNQSYVVNISSDDRPITLFTVDFAVDSLDLTKVIIREKDDGQALLTKGFDDGTEKTIFVKQHLSSPKVCVKDAEIEDIAEISATCIGEDEFFFAGCLEGETIGAISCEIDDGYYKISGLTHSGATELNMSGVKVGYFTVEYLNTIDDHKDGSLMPGEGVRICFEGPRSIEDDEWMRILFAPQWGGVTLNELWLPHNINTHTVHLYP